MEPASGHGWTDLQTDGSIEGETSLNDGHSLHRTTRNFFNSLLGARLDPGAPKRDPGDLVYRHRPQSKLQ